MISSLSAVDFIRNDPTNVGRVWDQMQISGLSPSRVPAAHAGYRLAGPSRSDNLPLSAKGAILQRIYHQKRQKNRVKVIIMSSQVLLPPPKVAEIEYCSPGGRYETWKQGRRDSNGQGKGHVDRRGVKKTDCLEIRHRGGMLMQKCIALESGSA